ncbi:hypothetical protein MFIFM68171_08294 [Madurella fahalii]|uniref:Uncharacterized protein n=1 Tax=Madurella fahalii TaxID=1157608 RepID=A0ABQ0GK03_9PEZI
MDLPTNHPSAVYSSPSYGLPYPPTPTYPPAPTIPSRPPSPPPPAPQRNRRQQNRVYLFLGALKNLLLTAVSATLAIWALHLAKDFSSSYSYSHPLHRQDGFDNNNNNNNPPQHPASTPTTAAADATLAVVSALLLVLWTLAYALHFVNAGARLAEPIRSADDGDVPRSVPFIRGDRNSVRRYLVVLAGMVGLHLVVMVAGWVWLGRMVKAGLGGRSGGVDVVGAAGMAGMAGCHVVKSLGLAGWYFVDGAGRERGEDGKGGIELADVAPAARDVEGGGAAGHGVGDGDGCDRLGVLRVLHPSLYFI